MKIVVLDGYTLNPGDLSWDELEKLGDVTIYDRTKPEQIEDRIKDADIILVNKVVFNRDIINKCSAKYIGLLATGYNNVDIQAAKERNIVVTNIPVYGVASVAQMTFAHILNICNQVENHNNSVMSGSWQNSKDWCYWLSPLVELKDKTIGIIGYGRIGSNVGDIAQAFGMKVLAYNKSNKKELENEKLKFTELDYLLNNSDIISIHCPLFEETKGIINKTSIAKMKDNVIIINTSRGELIVEEDLRDALNSGKVYAAGVDVVSKEPISKDNPLLKCKNVHITPHISWASNESRSRLLNISIENIKAYLEKKPVNVVNK